VAKIIEPVLVVNYSYRYIECTKLISSHEIPLAICLLKGISCVSTHYNTGLLLFYSMLNTYWAVSSGEKIQPVLVVNYSYRYIECIKLISDHKYHKQYVC